MTRLNVMDMFSSPLKLLKCFEEVAHVGLFAGKAPFASIDRAVVFKFVCCNFRTLITTSSTVPCLSVTLADPSRYHGAKHTETKRTSSQAS